MNKLTSEGNEGKYSLHFKEEQLAYKEKSVFAKATPQGWMTKKIMLCFLLGAKRAPSVFCLLAFLHCSFTDLYFYSDYSSAYKSSK